MVGQGPAVLAAGAGRVGCFLFCFFVFIFLFFVFVFFLSRLSYASSLGTRLDMLKY